jgi:hypothetical protein
MQKTSELCIKYGILFSKIEVDHFCNSFLVDASQKTDFWAKKMKNEYYLQRK